MNRKLFILGICAILLLSIIGIGCVENDNNDEESEKVWLGWPIITTAAYYESGHLGENERLEETLEIQDNYVTRVTCILNWTDEPDHTDGIQNYENQPDSFNLTVTSPWQEIFNSGTVFNPIGELGMIILTIEVQEDGIANSSALGEWTVNIQCGECGDQEGELGFNDFEDNGNGWEFSFYYEYHAKD